MQILCNNQILCLLQFLKHSCYRVVDMVVTTSSHNLVARLLQPCDKFVISLGILYGYVTPLSGKEKVPKSRRTRATGKHGNMGMEMGTGMETGTGTIASTSINLSSLPLLSLSSLQH